LQCKTPTGKHLTAHSFGLIQAHQQTTFAENFSTRAEVTSGEYFRENPVWQWTQQFVDVVVGHFSPSL